MVSFDPPEGSQPTLGTTGLEKACGLLSITTNAYRYKQNPQVYISALRQCTKRLKASGIALNSLGCSFHACLGILTSISMPCTEQTEDVTLHWG